MVDKLHGYLFNKNQDTCCQGDGPNMSLGLWYMVRMIIDVDPLSPQSRWRRASLELLLGEGQGCRNLTLQSS